MKRTKYRFDVAVRATEAEEASISEVFAEVVTKNNIKYAELRKQADGFIATCIQDNKTPFYILNDAVLDMARKMKKAAKVQAAVINKCMCEIDDANEEAETKNIMAYQMTSLIRRAEEDRLFDKREEPIRKSEFDDEDDDDIECPMDRKGANVSAEDLEFDSLEELAEEEWGEDYD